MGEVSSTQLDRKDYLFEYFTEVCLLGVLLIYYLIGFYYGSLLNEYTKKILLLIYVIYIGAILPYTVFIKKNKGLYNSTLVLSIVKRLLVNVFSANKQNSSHVFFKSDFEKHRFLFFLVKIIFIPIMLNFFVEYCIFIANNVKQANFNLTYILTDFSWFFLLSAIIFGLDTLYFSFGYLVEHNKLKNSIRSVDTSVLGWVVALACYKPFNNVTVRLFPMYADENVFYINSIVTSILYVFVLVFYLIYLFATFALGAKCSNLTNRGIVQNGVYKFVRHPAYSAKIFAWLLLCIPIFNVKILISMIAWIAIYLLRAYTEEQHLLKDKEYQFYCAKVKWKFIPYVF